MLRLTKIQVFVCLLSLGVGTTVGGYDFGQGVDVSSFLPADFEGTISKSDEYKTKGADAAFPAFQFLFSIPHVARNFGPHALPDQPRREFHSHLSIRAPPLIA
jgi:hypothetical protein